MNPAKRTARLAGLLYLVVIIGAGFAQGAVRSTLVVPGDAAATAANITASEMLFRAGFAADLVAFLGDLGVTVLLYVLLAPVSRTAALAMAAFRLVAHPAIGALNLLNHFAALQLLGGADFLDAFDPGQLQGLALLALDAHGTGYLIAGAFFGVHLALLGWLLTRSQLFPSVLGALILAAAAGYLVESFGMFLFPALDGLYTGLVTVTAVLGEVSLCLYLLVKGVRSQPAGAPPGAGASATPAVAGGGSA